MADRRFDTLIDPRTLAEHADHPRWVIVDCRFDLQDPEGGERSYLEAHIPGARYAHLDRDLSGAKTGRNGRHPLPTIDEMRERFGALGIGAASQVVAYDADTGMYAARLWWMLRFMGHDAVAVLDGGFARWMREIGRSRGGRESWPPSEFVARPRPWWRVTADEVRQRLDDPQQVLIDARAEPRFRGDDEPLDRVAGHIPGARSFFFQRNLADGKTFRDAAELAAEWRGRLGGHSPSDVVMYCGSGVTACHNLLAMAIAGLPRARLYAGSWSEWSSDPDRPVATGPENA